MAEPDDTGRQIAGERAWTPGHPRRGRARLGLVPVALIAVFVVVAALTHSKQPPGIAAGRAIPPFAVPLALSSLNGDANVATHAGEGEAGTRPACSVRGPRVLNVCQLYERGPLVLALFIDAGGCADVLGTLQGLAPQFPSVRFAAVAIKGDRESLRKLLSSKGVTIPVGYDRDGVLATLYRMLDCPQLVFVKPGGRAQSAPLLGEPSQATLRARVQALLASTQAAQR